MKCGASMFDLREIDECIQQSMFAISFRPKSPELYAGEPLLLQLVKDEARKQGKEHARINFALIYDHQERDHDGSISRARLPCGAEGLGLDYLCLRDRADRPV